MRDSGFGRPSPAAAEPAQLAPRGSASLATLRAGGGDANWLRLRAASVAGVRHRLAGKTVEDSFAWSLGERWLLAAVADGVGSLEGSARAAADAAQAAVSVLSAEVEELGGEDLVSSALLAGDEAAEGGGATTLVVAALSAGGEAFLGRVGDSTAWLLSGGEWEELFDRRDDDEPAATTTAALPAGSSALFERAHLEIHPGEVLVLTTDGVADPLRDGPTTVAPALAKALAEPPTPLELAALADFSRQGCHDDRTLLCVWLPQGR